MYTQHVNVSPLYCRNKRQTSERQIPTVFLSFFEKLLSGKFAITTMLVILKLYRNNNAINLQPGTVRFRAVGYQNVCGEY